MNSGSLLAAGLLAVSDYPNQGAEMIPTTQSGKTLIIKASSTHTTEADEITDSVDAITAGHQSVYITVN